MRKFTFLPLIALAIACGEKDTDDSGVPDVDGDGFDETEDCDDLDAAINPDADEVCDGVDNNCSGDIDDEAVDGVVYFVDADGDGDGDLDDAGVTLCEAEEGLVTENTDCDDTNIDVNPSAREVCDGLDNDCDGDIDDADADVDITTGFEFYEDNDGDGYGVDSGTTVVKACDVPSGYAELPDDCNDEDALIHPETVWYLDSDEDGYGGATSLTQCETPEGYVLDGTDCDDTSALASPDGVEVCDGLDNDCDTLTDDEDDDVDSSTFTTWYYDYDVDGYGTDDTTVDQCDAPTDYVDVGGDCNDEDSAINPAAEEIGDNGVDENCDGAGPSFPAGDYDESDADETIAGSTDDFGIRVGWTDTDNDGTDELIVSGLDTIYVFYGPQTSYTLADATWGGESGGSAGESLATGDFNGDGYGDVLIGAPDDDLAYLMYGSATAFSGSASLGDADVVFTGTGSEDFGSSVSNLGDVDGDGTDDLGIGAYNGGSSSEGVNYLYFSSYGTLSAATSNSDATQAWYGGGSYYWLGYGPQAGNGLGDLNGDGNDDFAVATDYSNSSTGGVYITYGSSSLSTGDMDIEADEDAEIEASSTSYTLFGDTVVPVGDLDDDGYDDFLIGAQGASNAFLILGNVTARSGSEAVSDAADSTYSGGNALGHSGDAADIDSDGSPDLAIGDHESYASDSAVYLFLGPYSAGTYDVDNGDYDVFVENTTSYSSMGSWVAYGDGDGDGIQDLAIGAAGSTSYGVSGNAYLFWGISAGI
jgi:hypothetical protein